MKYPGNILLVTSGEAPGQAAATRALRVADRAEARLTALVVSPPLPEAMSNYQEPYEMGLRAQLEERLEQSARQLKLDLGRLSLQVKLVQTAQPYDAVLEQVTADRHDLVIKEPEATSCGRGVKAGDLYLLHKCPCPVWLCRPASSGRESWRVAVAVEPEPVDEKRYETALALLRVARELSQRAGGSLEILSCWDYPFEAYLRHNAWFQVPGTDLAKIVAGTRAKHHTSLMSLIEASGIAEPYAVEHLRGQPENALPARVSERRIDLLVMGSAARSGVAGLLMGNTSDDILSGLDCSVLTLKPDSVPAALVGA